MQQQSFSFDERPVLLVSELVGQLKRETESRFRGVWVQGELSNLRTPGSGHLYFTLKDDSTQLAAVCFRMQARHLRFRPEDGLDVVARGTVSVYPPRGQLQIIVEQMEPVGRGALQLAFEELKARLQAEGLFDPARKKRLPLLPVKIGVVTSPTGAAVQDILRVLKRRNDRVSVLICPARVQGKGSAEEIAEGIRLMNQREDLDVLIVGRGGGSLEDLWAFNEESVARAIAESRIPVISAVGHEIDFTISDFVADLRAPTPSAAAEIVSAQREELFKQIEGLKRSLVQLCRLDLIRRRERLSRLVRSRAFVDAEGRLKVLLQRHDELRNRLQALLPPQFERRQQELAHLRKDLKRQVSMLIERKRNRTERAKAGLSAYSPVNVLERGYAIVSDSKGQIVRRADNVSPGEVVDVKVSRGEFRARRES